MSAKFSVLVVAAVPLFPLALACGGDDGGGGGIHVPDAGPGGSGQADAPGSANCFVESMYTPSFGSDTQFAETDGSGATGDNAHTEMWGGALNGDQTPDVIQLELYAGFGVFNGVDISPKTIQLTGPELNYGTCGACVRIFADATQQSSAAQYFATGGTVMLTSTTGTLQGTLSNVTFEKVTIAPAPDFTSMPVGDGCTTKVVNATMDATLEMGSGSGSATAGDAIAREAGPGPVRLVLSKRRY